LAKPQIGPLTSGRVRLRLLEEADLPMTLAWRNQDHIRKWFVHSDVINPDQHRRWYEGYRERDDDFVFVIEEVETLHRPIGQASVYRIDRSAKRAEFGRLMIGDPMAAGRGLARKATALLLAESTKEWGLERISLVVRPCNQAAIGLYQKCGFQPCGMTTAGDLIMEFTAPSELVQA